MEISEEMAATAARVLNKRLAEGNLYGVSREMLEAALAAREAEAGTVKVKTLEWREVYRNEEYFVLDATTILGCYRINSEYEINGRKFGPTWKADHTNGEQKVSLIDDAKAAAQADYEARILSALASPPAPHAAEIPEGWGMFPKQPNPEMVLAGKLADQLAAGFGEDWDTRVADIYRAMLAAAPHHNQEGGDT